MAENADASSVPTGGTDRARVRWLCRRGMKELDVLLSAFLDQQYDNAPPAEQAAFVVLLECQDPDIWAWILGDSQVDDPVMHHVIERISRRA